MKFKLLAALALTFSLHAERVVRQITVAAGTPVRLSPTNNTMVDRILIQMQIATSGGVGYVMIGVPGGTTPVANVWPTIQLSAGTTAAPGGSYTDSGSNIDISRIWIDGAHTGDTILVSYETK